MNKIQEELKKIKLETEEIILELKEALISDNYKEEFKKVQKKLIELEKKKLLFTFDFMYEKYNIPVSDFSEIESKFTLSINDLRDIIFSSYRLAMEDARDYMSQTPAGLTGYEVAIGAFSIFDKHARALIDLIELNRENGLSELPELPELPKTGLLN